MFFLWPLAVAATTCPPAPSSGAAVPPSISADGAVHLLVRGDVSACWWIVDEAGDARVGAHWDRSRRDPVALTALADGRAVVVFQDGGRFGLAVREETGGERHYGLLLPGAPVRLIADRARARVALVFAASAGGQAWLVDLDSGRVVNTSDVTPEQTENMGFLAGELVDDRGPVFSRGGDDAPR